MIRFKFQLIFPASPLDGKAWARLVSLRPLARRGALGRFWEQVRSGKWPRGSSYDESSDDGFIVADAGSGLPQGWPRW
jgi:hypothetical protein